MSPLPFAYDDRTEKRAPTNGATATADAVAEQAARKWWPFAKWVGGFVFAVAGLAAAAALAFADKPSKADVDQRIDERIEARAATEDKVKEMIHDLSPYNADRALLLSVREKLDKIFDQVSDIKEDVAALKEAIKPRSRR